MSKFILVDTRLAYLAHGLMQCDTNGSVLFYEVVTRTIDLEVVKSELTYYKGSNFIVM